MRRLLVVCLLLGLWTGIANAQPVLLEGALEVLHADYPNRAEFIYTIGPVQFVTARPLSSAKTGELVRVTGRRVGNALVAPSIRRLPMAQAIGGPTSGVQRTLLILVAFTDKPNPMTPAAAASILFGPSRSASDFMRESSYGSVSLAGDVVGPFLINMPAAGCNYSTIAGMARQAAEAAGVAVSTYRRLGYQFPQNGCTWWGLGTLGGTPSHFWVNGGLTVGLVAHEMGHNFGLWHSHAYECGAVTKALTGCSSIEYGDQTDVMGGGVSQVFGYNAPQRETLGWLPPAQTVTTGEVTLEPLGGPTGTRAIKVPGKSGETFYVSNRQRTGAYDTAMPLAMLGTSLHLVQGGLDSDHTYLLDATPETSNWMDPALPVGKTFKDPASPVEITTVSVEGLRVKVRVGAGTQPPDPPDPTTGVLADTFTRPDNPTTVGNGWVVHRGGFELLSGAAKSRADGTSTMTHPTTTASVDQTITASFTRQNQGGRFQLLLRAAGIAPAKDPLHYVTCYREHSNSVSNRRWVVARVTAGVQTILAQVPAPPVAMNEVVTFSCSIIGQLVTLREGGVTKISLPNAGAEAKGQAGIRVTRKRYTIDNVVVTVP